jgi:carbamoyltransferase
MAGGCALNSSANGKIFNNSPFKALHIQPAAGDDGTAIGAGLFVEHAILNRPRDFVMDHAYTGPEYGHEEVSSAIDSMRLSDPEAFAGIEIQTLGDDALVETVATYMADGKVVGWFQGRMEYGPRALGNRSIVADPRRGDMKEILNERIKRRETYRPFAPSILAERVGEVFETSEASPYMLMVYNTREAWREKIQAVNHINNTGRVQTVEKHINPRYHALITAFEAQTGVPVILNTSFNENEPVVNTPNEALACFLRTRMDVLALGNTVLVRV